MERNEDGLGTKVEFLAKAPVGPEMENVLVYAFEAPHKISFRSISGNVMTSLDGSYMFEKDVSFESLALPRYPHVTPTSTFLCVLAGGGGVAVRNVDLMFSIALDTWTRL